MSRPAAARRRRPARGGRDVYHHLVLLAKDETGYKNLIQLTTAAHLEGYYYKPRIDKELLARAQGGPDRALRLPGERDPGVDPEGPVAQGARGH